MNDGTIILIDDSASELRLCELALEDSKHDHTYLTFLDPISAYDYIESHIKEVFIIICDIKMPRMTGIELLEKINANRELRMQAIPFIFLSNSSAPEDIEKAYLLAAQGYFQKPLDLVDLTQIFELIISYWSIAHMAQDRISLKQIILFLYSNPGWPAIRAAAWLPSSSNA